MPHLVNHRKLIQFLTKFVVYSQTNKTIDENTLIDFIHKYDAENYENYLYFLTQSKIIASTDKNDSDNFELGKGYTYVIDIPRLRMIFDYIRTKPYEKVKSIFPIKEDRENNSFNPETFIDNLENSFSTLKDRINFANSHLQKIGTGTSRYVYNLSDNDVLKVAKHEKGIEQNKHELEMYKNANSNLLNPIKQWSHSNEYLVVPKATKITNSSFKNISGLSFKDFQNFLKWLYNIKILKKTGIKPEPQVEQIIKNPRYLPFYQSIIKLINSNPNFFFMDLLNPSAWGYVDGQLKVIDYGMSNDYASNNQ